MATQYYFKVANETIDVQSGKHDTPNITISMKESDYLDMVNGKLNGQMAFMSGKLKVAGDMGLAMRLQGLFKAREASDPEVATVQDIIDGSADSFNKDASKGLDAVFQFDLS
jgi:putative sterol carrier protein